MKSVLMSIQPKWCELTASGKKTVEVRKTKPKLETPFKCYIYCTKNTKKRIGHWLSLYCDSKQVTTDIKLEEPCYPLNGKVIGEFVCDEVIEFYEETVVHDELAGSPTEAWMNWKMNDKLCEEMGLYTMEDVERCTCLKRAELISYLYPKMQGYGWHISDLVIYENPKELGEFRYYTCTTKTENGFVLPTRQIKRPPQSWCYVEEGAE